MEEDKTNADTEVQAGADRNSAETDQGVSLNPICQEELYDPGRNVSINPNKDSILTLKRPVPDVRLGYASTGQGERAVVSHERPFGWLLAYK